MRGADRSGSRLRAWEIRILDEMDIVRLRWLNRGHEEESDVIEGQPVTPSLVKHYLDSGQEYPRYSLVLRIWRASRAFWFSPMRYILTVTEFDRVLATTGTMET